MNDTLLQLLAKADNLQAKLLAFRSMGEETLKSLREYYRVGLTYTSNAIEGNIDGNGRVARLLMNFSHIRNEFNIALIPAISRAEYITALEKAHENAEPLQQFMAERVIATQMDLLRLLGGVNDMCSQILNLLKVEPRIRVPYIAQKLQCSLRTTQRNLRILTEKGKIEYKGAAKNGVYEVIE